MNAMRNFTIKSLRANKVRTIVTIAGVALAAALLTAVLTSFVSLNGFLYNSEASMSGSWMIKATSSDIDALEDDVKKASADGEVKDSAILQEVGVASLSEEEQRTLGHYLPVFAVQGDAEDVIAFHISDGKAPENSNEIALFGTWKNNNVAIGDEVTFTIGQRQAIVDLNEPIELTVVAESDDAYDGPSTSRSGDYRSSAEASLVDGQLIDSTIAYLDYTNDVATYSETLTNTETMTFTVVGFYDKVNSSLSFGIGNAGIIGSSTSFSGPASAYVVVAKEANTDLIEEKAESIFPDASLEYHQSMLRYLGIRTNGSIWDTFFGIAVILAIVIVVACVSLIYNAIAISYAERKTQFGLMASIGASKAQLRRSILLEGLLIALVGIPLGMVIGALGCFITFKALGPHLARLLTYTDVPFDAIYDPWIFVFSAFLTLLTVLVSVFIPAIRVGREGIIETLRGSSLRAVSKKGIAASAKNVDPNTLWKKRGISGRLFGIGGTLARINKKRGMTKRAAASISLALAILLLMTAGSLNTFMGMLVKVANSEAQVDIDISVGFDSMVNNPSQLVPVFSEAYDELDNVNGAEGRGWALTRSCPIIFSDSLLGNDIENYDNLINTGGKLEDGGLGANGYIDFLDDEDFNEFLKKNNLDESVYYNKDKLAALAVGQTYSYDGSHFTLVELLKGSGSAEVLLGGTYNGSYISGFSSSWNSRNETFEFVPFAYTGDSSISMNMDEIELDALTIDVPYLATESFPVISRSDLGLIMPMSMISVFDSHNKLGEHSTQRMYFSAGFDTEGVPHGEVAEELSEVGNEFFDRTDLGIDLREFGVGFAINDRLEEQENNQMLATIVNVFCLLFTIILALIAMANVFNTITNSLILRRREFAVMRSIGLSNGQFRKMIIDECASFGIVGLIPGMIISIGVSYLLYSTIAQTLVGVPFTLPWGYVAFAVLLTFVVMDVAVAFGMHKCRADNLVEALRMDNI